ncbi:MAG TPA: sulfotransferase [Solirubrobacteraceae bacterium]|nr:sulfotransferase [Solirubrobacteraceae bacterium]
MAQPSPPEAPDRPKVVYVMGSGRSGSTILGIALGNCEDFFYAGELDNWLTRAGTPALGGSERTRFWSRVGEQVEGAEDLFGGESHRSLERSGSVFRIHRWRARRRLRPRYRQVTEGLYRAIAHTAGVTHVVDTAHFPLRARELRGIEGIDLYLVFLVRDPQSVVASFARNVNRHDAAARRRLAFTTNADLWLTHLLSAIVFLRHRRDRRMFLRHEDFLADPEGALRDILDRLDSPAAVPDLTSLSTGLPFRGNRLIGSDVVALQAQAERPVGGSRLTALLQLPWRAVFPRMRPAVTASSPREPVAAGQPR